MKELKIKTPTIIVIFGATGDLSRKKLLPALFDLHQKWVLPKKFKIIGFARTDLTNNQFKDLVAKVLREEKHRHLKSEVRNFLDNIEFHRGKFEELADFKKLAQKINKLNQRFKACPNRLLHLSVHPKYYSILEKNISNSGLGITCIGENEGWTRILVEKPFGRDVKTAKKFDNQLSQLFEEKQIFRIDHYLAKETLQNILTFRFSNTIFDPVWNNKYISKVEIKLFEEDDVGSRINFYEGIGALRDVGQNHMLQILAMIAMDNPRVVAAQAIREKRVEVLKSLVPMNKKTVVNSAIRGQYEGYKKEKGVPKNSKTETYFQIKTYLKSKRWQGVPFYLEAGKALNESKVEINIYFKKTDSCFECDDIHHHPRNTLSFRIQPDEGIDILFWIKKPGLDQKLVNKKLSFNYEEIGDSVHFPTAYEYLLFEAMRGDQMLFSSTEEVNLSWKYVMSILKYWQGQPLYIYKRGSSGPKHKIN